MILISASFLLPLLHYTFASIKVKPPAGKCNCALLEATIHHLVTVILALNSHSSYFLSDVCLRQPQGLAPAVVPPYAEDALQHWLEQLADFQHINKIFPVSHWQSPWIKYDSFPFYFQCIPVVWALALLSHGGPTQSRNVPMEGKTQGKRKGLLLYCVYWFFLFYMFGAVAVMTV